MNIDKLKEYYNRIDKCSVYMDREVDFEYVQTQIGKIAFFTEELSRITGEILIELTRLEHQITDMTFEFELKSAQQADKSEVKSFSSSKERTQYINYVLLKEDFRKLTDLQQEQKDIKNLFELAKKKSKDLDRAYPKLKLLWESVQTEMKYIKKIGSDSEYINKVRDSINKDNENVKPIFTDSIVDQIKNQSEVITQEEILLPKQSSIDLEVENLLADL